jgi:hypothetical protein
VRHLRRSATLAFGILIGASAAVAADSPSPTYTGCLSKDGTIARIAIGPSPLQACRPNERQITWNQTGPQGAPGAPAPQVQGA